MTQSELLETPEALETLETRPGEAGQATPKRAPRRAARALRVALVAEAAGGGVAMHLADLIRALKTHDDIECHLIVPEGSRFDAAILNRSVTDCCASLTQVPMLRSVSWRDVPAYASVFRQLMRIRPDVVHSHSSKAGALARLCVGPWQQVYTPHAVYTLNPYLPARQKRFYGAVENLLGRLRTHTVIAVSDDEAEHLRETLRIPSERVRVVYNGINVLPLLPRGAARAQLGLPEDAFVVGFAGRLDFQKGVDRLLKIALRLEAAVGQNVIFAVLGPGDFAQAAGVQEGRLPANLAIFGARDNARQYFRAFDVLALPSRYEGFPYVYLEAMAAGVPIVTTRVAGARALVDAHEVGLVVPNSDATEGFEAALLRLFGDAALRGRMSANCALALERFSARQMSSRIAGIYREAVGGFGF